MKKIRLKNDIRISWAITTNGKQETLTGKSLQVQLVVFNEVVDIKEYSVQGNVISFYFLGKDQKYCGVYTLVCKDVSNGNLNTVDKTAAFELVPHTEDECGTDNPNVALEVVTLKTDRDSSTIAKAATVSVGEVKTLKAGSQAYVTNTGTVNDAILNFGIPSGGNGENGLDGKGVVAEPSSVTFNVDNKGSIGSSQDKLIRMKAYIGGIAVSDAEIVKISATNFKSTPSIETDGCSFYLRGSDLKSVTTTDLDGNSITVPVTQAQLEVTCKMPESSLRYTANVRVFVNTQTFYTSLVSNQREFKQTFTEINNSLDEQGVKMEKYYSEWQQTARSLSYTISQNKQDADGNIESLSNKLTSTANSLTSTIEANKKAADESIENTKTEIKQTTDEISATVTANKQAADGSIESLSSQVKQNADNIAIANSRFNADGSLKNTSGLVTTYDKAELASREYVDGKVVSEAVINVMIKDGISSATIKADQIDFEGHSMNFKTGEITITSDGFTLDKDGNAKFTGDLTAKSLRLKISPSGNVLGGALLLGGGQFTMPTLGDGECVNLKVVAPLITRSSLTPTLVPANGNVYFWNSANKTELPKSENVELDYGAYDLTGYGVGDNTYWVIG